MEASERSEQLVRIPSEANGLGAAREQHEIASLKQLAGPGQVQRGVGGVGWGKECGEEGRMGVSWGVG